MKENKNHFLQMEIKKILNEINLKDVFIPTNINKLFLDTLFVSNYVLFDFESLSSIVRGSKKKNNFNDFSFAFLREKEIDLNENCSMLLINLMLFLKSFANQNNLSEDFLDIIFNLTLKEFEENQEIKLESNVKKYNDFSGCSILLLNQLNQLHKLILTFNNQKKKERKVIEKTFSIIFLICFVMLKFNFDLTQTINFLHSRNLLKKH